MEDMYDSDGVSTHASAGDATEGTGAFLDVDGVSTHASAGDATQREDDVIEQYVVSTHASAGDATGHHVVAVILDGFQLTRPRGTRQHQRYERERDKSFNSRVRGGRDRLRRPCRCTSRSFNSRVRGGRDE